MQQFALSLSPPLLFYDAVSICTIALNGRVIDECKLERILKEVLCPLHFRGGTEGHHKYLSQDSQCPGRSLLSWLLIFRYPSVRKSAVQLAFCFVHCGNMFDSELLVFVDHLFDVLIYFSSG
jgi:hypothetical protein